jgi:hypothetical protein
LVFEHVVGRVANYSVTEGDLVVVVFVHENEAVTIAVKVGHIALVDVGDFNLDTGVEGLVDNLARDYVLELAAHECRAFAWLDVLEFDYSPKLTFDVEY